jgi:hypothetical protein
MVGHESIHFLEQRRRIVMIIIPTSTDNKGKDVKGI